MSIREESRSIAATLTPSGRGAVAVVGIHGPLADAALAKHFQRNTQGLTSFAPGHPALSEVPTRRILYGNWQANAEASGAREDVVLTRFETHWELGCHGGAIAAAAILADLRAAGIETVSWQEWLTQTQPNRLQVSAAQALAAAQSPAAALALLQAAKLTEVTLQEILSALSDEPSGGSLRSTPDTQASEIQVKPQARLDALLSTAHWAKHLVRPWKIVLAGLPNAGKSSLLNALVGYERAIVFEQPGTTRDVVTAAAAYEGWRWELRDTAGLRATEDELEAQGIERTNAMLAASDVTVLVIDGTRPWKESEPLRRAQPHAIVVHNKCDLVQDAQTTGLAVSAVTGRGLEELRAAIHKRLALPDWPAIGACVWDAALEHDLRTLQRVLAEDPAALPAVLSELRTWIE